MKRAHVGSRYYDLEWNELRGCWMAWVNDSWIMVGLNWDEGNLRDEIANDIQIHLDKK